MAAAIFSDSGVEAGNDVPIYYDPMISKLIAWAEDRPASIDRMRRALGEYVVSGIRTTLPFFTWLFQQREFLDGAFHTTYLDEVLAARNGAPFVEPAPATEDVAVIAAALHAVLSSASLSSSNAAGPERQESMRRWKAQARAEGLRD